VRAHRPLFLDHAVHYQKPAVENAESCFFNRFGQLIYREPRGRLAGYSVPELGMHRGRLHRVTGDRPFRTLDEFVSQEELRALSDHYKRIAGYSSEDLAAADARPAN